MKLFPLLALTISTAALAAPQKLPHFQQSAALQLEGKGAIYALQSRLDDLCRKLEAAAKSLGS